MAFQIMKYFICKIKLFVAAMCIAIFIFLTSHSYGDMLVWHANGEADLAGYYLYYGTSSRNYRFVVDMGNVTEYSLNNLNLREPETYFIALTVYDTAGNESDFSEELTYFSEDEIPGDVDNCPEVYNPDQEDSCPPGGNGIGDACECEGDFYCDNDVDGSDGRIFKADYCRSSYNNPCTSIDPCTGDFDCDGDIDGSDGRIFKADFGRSLYNNPCPICSVREWCVYP